MHRLSVIAGLLGLLAAPASMAAQVVTTGGTGTTTRSGAGSSTVAVPPYVLTSWVFTFGDSKTANLAWQPGLIAQRVAADPAGHWVYINAGVSGTTIASTVTVAGVASVIDPVQNVLAADPVRVLINFGANDVGGLPTAPLQAGFEANYLTLIDAILVKWPQAVIYLARAWRQGYDTHCDTLADWIANVVAARPGGHVVLGMDERIWLKGSDNGVSETLDGVHYSTAGTTKAIAAWYAVLWP